MAVDGAVHVSAVDDARIGADVSLGTSSGGGAAVGGVVVRNDVRGQARAQVLRADVTAGSVRVEASDEAVIEAKLDSTAKATGGDGAGLAVGGVIATNLVLSQVEADITDSQVRTTEGGVEVLSLGSAGIASLDAGNLLLQTTGSAAAIRLNAALSTAGVRPGSEQQRVAGATSKESRQTPETALADGRALKSIELQHDWLQGLPAGSLGVKLARAEATSNVAALSNFADATLQGRAAAVMGETAQKHLDYKAQLAEVLPQYADLASRRYAEELQRSAAKDDRKSAEFAGRRDDAADRITDKQGRSFYPADNLCAFIERLPHVKGPLAGEPIRLEPWQVFILSTAFGWVKPDGKRRFRRSYIEVPRGNAKSTLSSAVALCMLTADGEGGAEVYSLATTRDQARIVFGDAQTMARKSAGFRSRFDVNVGAGQPCGHGRGDLSGRSVATDFRCRVGAQGAGSRSAATLRPAQAASHTTNRSLARRRGRSGGRCTEAACVSVQPACRQHRQTSLQRLVMKAAVRAPKSIVCSTRQT